MSSVRLVADGMLSKVGPKSSLSGIRESISRTREMVTKNSGAITPTMTDTPTVYGQYKTRMNQFVAPGIGLGLDGQTMAYVKPDAKKARAIFSSKYVPFSDGTELLTGATKKTMSQRGYGNVPASMLETVSKVSRIGFNNTLADTSGGKISFSMAKPLDLAGIMAHPNNPVCSDFPRGPGVGGSAPLWEDGTYRDTIAAIHKVQDTPRMQMPAIMKDPRKEIFDAQALVGGQVFGNELLKETLEEEFAKEKDQEIRRAARLARPLASEEELGGLVEQLQLARRTAKIAKQLRLPEGSLVAQNAAFAEIRSEEIERDRRADLANTLAQQAEARAEVNKQSERRYRIVGGIRRALGRVPKVVAVGQARQGLAATAESRARIKSNLDDKITGIRLKYENGEINSSRAKKLLRQARSDAKSSTYNLSKKVSERVAPGKFATPEDLARRPRGAAGPPRGGGAGGAARGGGAAGRAHIEANVDDAIRAAVGGNFSGLKDFEEE